MFPKAQTWLTTHIYQNRLLLRRDVGVMSFSFDDAMHSACEAGREALEQRHCLGTWYVAGALTDQVKDERRYHSITDIQELASSGHHIGCHTYSHRPCDQLTPTEIAVDLQRNVEFFRKIGLPTSDLHFSFPFGAVNKASKLLASTTFKSSRIVGGGIQVGFADLNGLRSEQLYQHSMTRERLSSLAKEVAAKKGWLIFQTHDVEDAPSQWGCTRNLLDYAIQSALDCGCVVLPVDQAVAYFKHSN